MPTSIKIENDVKLLVKQTNLDQYVVSFISKIQDFDVKGPISSTLIKNLIAVLR